MNRSDAVLETAALPMSYTPEMVLTSGVEPESPGSQPSTLPLSYVSMVRWLIRTATKLNKTGIPIGGDGSPLELSGEPQHQRVRLSTPR